MAEPSPKKRKTGGGTAKPITDPRFSNIQSDPRFRVSNRRRPHVKVDKRFSHMLKDEDFARKAKVDRYGRPVEDNSELKRLKTQYEFEDEEEQDIENARKKPFDPIRDGGYSDASSFTDTSSDSDDSDQALEEEESALALQEASIKTGDPSTRIAVVNLDWDNIRAVDLMAVLSSFIPSGGRLLDVSIYPSQFGKEQMEREEMEGPPKELFNSSKDQAAPLSDQQIQDALVEPDSGKEIDSTALRRYQLHRLRYFYAILHFSSIEAASAVYESVDGAEYLSTANFFDLRFVPDEVSFDDDEPREKCEKVPDGYKPNDFVTGALQHSNVKLTWDAEDTSRKDAQARAFRGSRRDIDENDLKAYLASDTSSDEENDVDAQESKAASESKEQQKQKMRSLLGLAAEPTKKKNSETKPIGDVQVTFSSGLLGDDGAKKSVFENDPDLINETTVEKYVRKERERKSKRKEKLKHLRNGTGMGEDDDNANKGDNDPEEPTADLGFDDPFFAPEQTETSSTKRTKAERLAKRAAREAEEAATATNRSELELLMADANEEGTGMRHFDMREIERAEKTAKKKQKKGKKSKKDISKSRDQADTETPNLPDFKVDTQDPRFSRLYESHEFAIDPTNPKYKATEGMKALLEEGRKQRGHKSQSQSHSRKGAGAGTAGKVGAGKPGISESDDVRRLVEKVKNRR